MKRFVLVAVLVAGVVLGGFAWSQTSWTECYASFENRADADHAAAAGVVAGWDTDIEEDGPDARRAASRGARGIGVTFRNGETGADAWSLRRAFAPLVAAERGTLAHTGDGCTEVSPLD